MEKMETCVSAEDVRRKWEDVEATVKSKVQQKALGMSYVTIGAIVLGAGALGAAFWLGRRSAMSGQKMEPPKPGESFVGLEQPQLAKVTRSGNGPALGRVLEPAVDRLVASAVSAVTERMKYKPSCEARL